MSNRTVFALVVCAGGALLIAAAPAPFPTLWNHPRYQATPPDKPELFAPGVINTDADEYGPTLSPDGKELYFARRTDRSGKQRLMVARIENGVVKAPTALLSEDQWGDSDPSPSLDGKQIFFGSRRPLNGGTAAADHNLWVIERTARGWSAPRTLGSPPNSTTYENYPVAARNGNLYFASYRASGKNDLFVSRFNGGRYAEPEEIKALNTADTDADPYIAPDESYIIFSSSRAGGRGKGDLFISRRQNVAWSAPVAVASLNTADYEYTPFVSPDGKALFFSRGLGEIWWVSMKSLGL